MANNTKPILTLNQFILKQEVKNLYRQFFRTIKEVPDKNYQNEIKEWTRAEFRQNSNHTDELVIKMYLEYGKKSLKQLQNSVCLAK
ncbi:LYR motif-containing protein 2 [Anthonomus grandis grandis]|uniref:LYR motif-containing protein 2 n=1 Tax=Anthonomus grandis grandis TaxID=2921223 RepID=UPI002165F54D|nr:LYR motif-containing protein 2 [Anthonomus grandis grandis]XP_050309224.1 LYR motif-containing protein 2 [Anthonomus grandis grandis]